MFVDTSVIVAILSRENDADHWTAQLDAASALITSPLVVLEAVMRLSSKLRVEPADAELAVNDLLAASKIVLVPIAPAESALAVKAFADFGKERGHPAQLNLADCLSYACAKSRGVPLLYKGSDFAKTDIK